MRRPIKFQESVVKGFLLIVLLAGCFCSSVKALTERSFPFDGQQETAVTKPLELSSASHSIEEVSPPGAVLQIKDRLKTYHPKLFLESPSPEIVLTKKPWELVLYLEDWPLAFDSVYGLGPHVVVQLDDSSPIRITKKKNEKLHIDMEPLTPGSHRLSAYVAYPWGEAVKERGASINWRIHCLQKLEGTQPASNDPWLTIAFPSNLSPREPQLIDWLLWNAPLQGLKEGDDKWRVRISDFEESFVVDAEGAIWLNGLSNDKKTINFELIDQLGKPIQPIFNNKLLYLDAMELDQPIWMNKTLTESELNRLIGEEEFLEPEDLLGETEFVYNKH